MPSGISLEIPTRTLFLLRHATAEQDAPRDHQRALSVHGLAEAEALGIAWENALPWPEVIHCSDALRTRQTCMQICTGAGKSVPENWDSSLYEASPGEVLALIHALPEDATSALIIGHNPTIHQCAAMLSNPESLYGSAGKSLMRDYAPCTLSVLRVPVGTAWAEIEPASLTLLRIHRTQDGWI